jgi:hypothetical protein
MKQSFKSYISGPKGGLSAWTIIAILCVILSLGALLPVFQNTSYGLNGISPAYFIGFAILVVLLFFGGYFLGGKPNPPTDGSTSV